MGPIPFKCISIAPHDLGTDPSTARRSPFRLDPDADKRLRSTATIKWKSAIKIIEKARLKNHTLAVAAELGGVVWRMKNLLIFLLLLLLIWFGSAVVRLENIGYANDLNMCPSFDPSQPNSVAERRACLDEIQTRTSFVWHLLYGLRIL